MRLLRVSFMSNGTSLKVVVLGALAAAAIVILLNSIPSSGNTNVAVGQGLDASQISYTPADLSHWEDGTDPGNVDGALDELARTRRTVIQPASVLNGNVNVGAFPFTGQINGSPTSTSVPYDTDSNEQGLMVNQALHNTTRNEKVRITGVNTSTNTISVAANTPDDAASWSDNDAITTASQTNTGRGGTFVDVDVTDFVDGDLPASIFACQMGHSQVGSPDKFLMFHSYETYSGAKEQALQGLVDGKWQYRLVVLPNLGDNNRFYITVSNLNWPSTATNFSRVGCNYVGSF